MISLIMLLTLSHIRQIQQSSSNQSHCKAVKQQFSVWFLHQSRSKHKKVQTNAYLFWHGHTICTFFNTINFGEIPFVKHNLPSTKQAEKNQPKQSFFLSHFSLFLTIYLLFNWRFVAWQKGFPWTFAYCVCVKVSKCLFEPFCVWILF